MQTILKDHLVLRRVKSRLVPNFLNFFEKEHVKQCFLTIKASTNKLSWVYAHYPETTDQSSEYRLKGEAKPKRPRTLRYASLA